MIHLTLNEAFHQKVLNITYNYIYIQNQIHKNVMPFHSHANFAEQYLHILPFLF